MSGLVCLFAIMLVPLAAAGLALIHQGLGRSRSAAHAMLATLCVVGVAAIVFVLVGFAWAGYPSGAVHAFTARGVRWDWLGAGSFLGRDVPVAAMLSLCLQMFCVGIAGLIPLSAGTDRWRLGAICLSTAFLAGCCYPLFSHWVWGGGWLAGMTANLGLPGFLDVGGAGVVQVVGGLGALAVAWILGPRRGKYSQDGMAIAIPGHNIVLVMFGCMLGLVGWIGLDVAGSVLLYGVKPEGVAGIVVNAMLSAAGGCLAAVLTTQVRYRKPDASLSANGWIAGLVAGSAGCGFVSPLVAVFTGVVAGTLVTFLVETLELRLLVDDPGGAISVHAGAGIWGLLAVGLFGPLGTATRGAHVLAQVVGVATLLGVMLPLVWVGNMALNRWVKFRVDRDGDWQGMDIRELGAGAYPEFVIHADEFVPR